MKSLKCGMSQINLTICKQNNKKKGIKKFIDFTAYVFFRNCGTKLIARGSFVIRCGVDGTGKRSIGWRIPITPHAIRSPEFL